jgi:hypothetical protein
MVIILHPARDCLIAGQAHFQKYQPWDEGQECLPETNSIASPLGPPYDGK